MLPDHLHCVWTLPEGDADFPVRWGAIKSRFTRRVGFHPPLRRCAVCQGGMVGWNPTLRVRRARCERATQGSGSVGIGVRGVPETVRGTVSAPNGRSPGVVRDEDDYARCIEYCWAKLVKNRFVADPKDWRWTSFHRDNPSGRVPPDHPLPAGGGKIKRSEWWRGGRMVGAVKGGRTSRLSLQRF